MRADPLRLAVLLAASGLLVGCGTIGSPSPSRTYHRITLDLGGEPYLVHIPTRFSSADSAAYVREVAEAFARGTAEAERDLALGAPRFKIYGLNALEVEHEAGARLRQAFGVQIEVVAGCVVYAEWRAEWAGYNRRVEAAMDARYGPGTFRESLTARPDRPRR